jgi:hypothetical protein
MQPEPMYNINPSFWEDLYNICTNTSNKKLPIIDCLGPWLSPLVTAVNLGVPYFNIDPTSERYEYFTKNNCASFVNVVALNASEEKINEFYKTLKDCIKDAKENCKKEVLGKFFFVLFFNI